MKKLFQFILNLFKKKKETTTVEGKETVKVEPVSKFITENDFVELSNEFGIEKAALKAIFTVEAGGKSGFLQEDPNIPVTLEEGHVFYKYIQNKFGNAEQIAKNYPTICYKSWTKSYYKTGLKEYDRYLLAKSIDEECAMMATSWGMGQCMGFNYKACGYNTVFDFVNAMYVSERNQLKAMCNFIKSNTKMYNALKNKDFKTFALCYNGSGQVDYYADKLESAYKKAS